MRTLREEITCPHCWERFEPEDVLWYSEHPELGQDPYLVANEFLDRKGLCFLPTRFDLKCHAIDAKGLSCRGLACPSCHLPVPRSFLERAPLFVSILGNPTCGKSYYLAALVRSLRRELPVNFQMEFSDADTMSNKAVADNEQILFANEYPDRPAILQSLIGKTQMTGDLYNIVGNGDQSSYYARPSSFLLGPTSDHPNYKHASHLQRVIALYDNAGEHFYPGADSSTAPGTRHLVESNFLLFLFDPTQDSRWHAAMHSKYGVETPKTKYGKSQEVVLREAAQRIGAMLTLADGEKIRRPLIVVICKADVWEQDGMCARWDRVTRPGARKAWGVDLALLEQLSGELREELMESIPEIVLTAQQKFDQVYYVPATVLGRRPDGEGADASIRPKDIEPWGVSLPFLIGLTLSLNGAIEYKPAPANAATTAPFRAEKWA